MQNTRVNKYCGKKWQILEETLAWPNYESWSARQTAAASQPMQAWKCWRLKTHVHARTTPKSTLLGCGPYWKLWNIHGSWGTWLNLCVCYMSYNHVEDTVIWCTLCACPTHCIVSKSCAPSMPLIILCCHRQFANVLCWKSSKNNFSLPWAHYIIGSRPDLYHCLIEALCLPTSCSCRFGNLQTPPWDACLQNKCHRCPCNCVILKCHTCKLQGYMCDRTIWKHHAPCDACLQNKCNR